MQSITVVPSNFDLALGAKTRTFAVGQLVKYPCNTLHGKGTESGTIKQIKGDYAIEVKRQLGGYVTIDPRDILL